MVYCYVPFCSSQCQNSEKRTPNVSFHEFPCQDDIRRQWIKNIARNDKNGELQVPADRSRVCSLHFDSEDFLTGLKLRRLKKDAVPTIFPGYPSYMQPKTRKKRPPRKTAADTAIKSPSKLESIKSTNTNYVSVSIEDIVECDNSDLLLIEDVSMTPQNDDVEIAVTELVELTGCELLEPTPIDSSKPFTPKPWITKPGRKKQVENVIKTKDVGTSFRAKTAEIAVQVSVISKASPQHQKKVRRLACKNGRLIKANTKLRLEVNSLKQQLNNPLLKTVETIERGVESNDMKAVFLKELSVAYGQRRHKWSDAVMKHCIHWHSQSPKTYNFIRRHKFLDLPSLATLRRYHPNSVTSVAISNNTLVDFMLDHDDDVEATESSEDEALDNVDAGPHQMTVVLTME